MEPLNAFMLAMQTIIVPGLVFGSQLALGALGITLIYSILRFATFAHSESMAFAAAGSVLGIKLFTYMGLSSLLSLAIGLPFVIAATIGLFIGINFLVFRFYQQSRAVAVIFTVVSVGVMFITNSLVRFLVGPQEKLLINRNDKPLYWPNGEGDWIDLLLRGSPFIVAVILASSITLYFYTRPSSWSILATRWKYTIISTWCSIFGYLSIRSLFFSPSSRLDIEWLKLSVRNIKKITGLDEAFTLTLPQAATLVIAILAVVALFDFLNRTRAGKAMRAFSDNEDLAQLSGINPQRVIQLTWVVAGILTVLAGVLYGMDKGFKPFTYVLLLLPLFAAAVVGGIGNPVGAIVGGFVIAFAELIITYNYKKLFNYLLPDAYEFSGNVQIMTTENKFAVTFAVLVLVLIVRPTGIFRGKVL